MLTNVLLVVIVLFLWNISDNIVNIHNMFARMRNTEISKEGDKDV